MAKKKNKNKLSIQKRFSGRTYLAVAGLLSVLGVAFVLYGMAATTGKYTYDPATGKQSGRMFTADSPINQPIPADVKYTTDGQTRIKKAGVGQLSLIEWAWPIFDADSSTPKRIIYCYLTDPTAPWDRCNVNGINGAALPVPNNIVAEKGGDGHVIVLDNTARKIYSYWIWKDCTFVLNPYGAQYCPARGDVASMDGSGVGGGTNVAQLASTPIRTYEIEQGVIDRAISFGTSTTCKGEPVYPALSSDGVTVDQATCMPIGSRIQLDPTVNVDAIPGITKLEKIIAKALQKYGAYADDTGSSFGFPVELDRTGRNVYQQAGAAPGADYFPMRNIPWDKVKIIQPQWNKDGSKAYNWTGSTNGTGFTTVTTATPAPTTTTTPKPSLQPTVTPTITPRPTVAPTTVPQQSVSLTAPTNLVDTAKFTNDLVVGWGPSFHGSGQVGYKVSLNGVLQGTTVFTGYRFSGLKPNTEYRVKVTAYDQSGGEASVEKTFRTYGWCFILICG